MKRHVIRGIILLIGVIMALHTTGSIKVYAKEGDDFLFGEGTKYNPYLVSTYEDIVKLRDAVDGDNSFDGVYFRQTEDILFPNGINWNPIGDLEHAFAGIYDGNGHTLSNIYSEDQHAGLFSLLAGEIRNLGIESGYFYGSCVGSITSHGTGTAKIINCYNKAMVCGDGRAGGITDNFPGQIMFCWNFGSVTGTNESVVIAGITSYGGADIRFCYSVEGDRLVSDATFTGKIADSKLLEREAVSVYMQRFYEDMFATYAEAKESESKEKELITRGNTIFMVFENGELHFDKEYEPEVFLTEKQQEKERFIGIWESGYQFEGSGSKEEPFLISSYEDLVRLRDCVDADININYEEKYFEQTEDIYFPDGVNWNPIGDLEHMFAGVYDGGGHVLSNIYCDDPHAGVFSMLAGEVRNLGVESGEFYGDYVGSITSHGIERAKIINCYNKADVTGNYRAGGLVDNFPGEILFSWNFGKVSGKQDAILAGICSYGSPKVKHCYSTAEAEAVDPQTFCGELYESGKIENVDVAEKLRQNEAAYEEVLGDEILVADDIQFLNVVGPDKIGFDKSYIPMEVAEADRIEYLPEVLLFGITVLLGVITLIIGYRHRKYKKSALESQKKEESDESDWIAVDKRTSWKRIRERATAAVLTAIIFLSGFSYVMGVCKLESARGVLNLEYWRKKENQKTDVLLIGGSSVSANIEVGELWKEKGIAAYCIGAAGSKIDDNYYRLIAGDKDHSCKLIVLELRGAATDSAMDSAMNIYRRENISGLNISLNKLHYINATIEPQERLYCVLDFPLFHGRYREVTKWDFRHASSFGKDDKGTWTVFYGSEDTLELDSAADVIEFKVLDQKQEYYLRRIIEYCEANDRELLLLKTPDGNRIYDQPFYNTVTLIAEEYGVPFLDMNQYDEEIGLTSADFWTDNYHLNVEGARKCTAFFGDYLMNHYTLLDHRGHEGYVSWDRFAANREDLYLRAITDNKDYFDELLRDKRKIIVISCGMSGEKSEQYLSVKKKLDACEYEWYDAEDVLYGEDGQNTWTLGSNTVTVQKDYQVRQIYINEKTSLSVESPGIILIVYDEVTDQVADVAVFTNENGFSVQHLYVGGDD